MFDPAQPVEIAADTWWVGKRDPGAIFHSNPYLRVFDGVSTSGQHTRFNLLIDPGSNSDYAVVSNKVGRVASSVTRLSAIFINHQDPDVGSSATVLISRYAPRASILCSEDTWRLIVHLGLPKERFVATERHPNGLQLPTGHKILFVPSPFCHFRGAVMVYDPQTRVLFSGDLFGGLTPKTATDLWADESDWAGMRAFHQLYMPARSAIERTIYAIRKLEPAVEIIAPQHGRLLRGPWVDHYLDRLGSLPVGLDILLEEDEQTLQAWNQVQERIIRVATELMGSEVNQRLSSANLNLSTLDIYNGYKVTSRGRWTVEQTLALLIEGAPSSVANILKMEAMVSAELHHLPVPQIRLDEDADEIAPEQEPF